MMDSYLTKPVNTLFYLSFENINPGSLLLAVPGMLMIVYSAGNLGISPGFWNISGFVFLIVLMWILMFDLMVLLRCTAFWFTRVDSLLEFENEIVNFSFRVPGGVFKGISKVVFYVILPYGLMATIPTQFFTGVLEGRYWVLTIGITAVFSLLTWVSWKAGLKHYGSTS